MDNFDLKKYLAEGKLLKEDEGTYRVYMNSDMDEPERINYEEYFEFGTKAEMIEKAKEYAKDKTNQYGDPILVKVVHRDNIDDVAWTNTPVNEAGVLDRYRSGETPSREQFNRLHTNNRLAKIFSHKKRKLTPDEFKTLTDSLGIKLVDNPLPLTDRDEAPDPWMKNDVARGTRYKKSYIKMYDDKYKEIDEENDEKIFSWVENLDDYEIERIITRVEGVK